MKVASYSAGLAVALVLVCTACLSPGTSECGDRICPAGYLCVAALDECVLEQQVAACAGEVDGLDCDVAGEPGLCVSEVCRARGCGNGIEEPGEICDDGNTRGGDGCSAACDSTEECGNGIRDVGEGCDCGDGSVELPDGCSQPNGNNDGAECRDGCALPHCGDGVLDPLEDCEDSLPLAKDCVDYDYHVAAGLSCVDCLFDDSGCSQWCGDGVINGPPGEEDCDGEDLGGADCTTLDFYEPANLGCTSFCRFDVSECVGYCGDGDVGGGELCDGPPGVGQSCLDYFNFDVGLPRCTAQCFPDFDDCDVVGWRAMFGAPAGYDIWGLGRGDLFAAGDRVYRFDGSSWTEQATTASNFRAVYGTGPDNVYAATGKGKIERFDGTGWTDMASGTSQRLSDIWIASSGDEGFVVGPKPGGVSTYGWVAQLGGGSWSQNIPMDGVVLVAGSWNGVWGSDMNHVVIVGDQGFTYKWQDGMWTDISSPTIGSVDLLAVWGVAEDEIYALGLGGKVFLYDDTSWVLKYQLDPSASFTDIGGTASDRIFVTGVDTIARFDGKAWHTRVLDNGLGIMNGVVVTDSREAFAVATGGVLEYSGSDRRTVSSPASSNWAAIWGENKHNLIAVGDDSRSAHDENGSWTSDSLTPSERDFYGVWGTSMSNAYAVGQTGSINRWDGGWTSENSQVSQNLHAVWGAGPSSVYAVGYGQTILHSVGDGSWSPMDVSAFGCDFEAVWGADDSAVFAAGAGCVVRYDGGSWSPLSFSGGKILGIWGAAADDVFFVGAAGNIWHYDGVSFEALDPGGTTVNLNAIAGTAHENLYVAGDDGTLLHFDGHSWIPVETYSNVNLNGLWMDDERLVVVGEGDTIIDYQIDNACELGQAIGCGDTLSGSTSGGVTELHVTGCGGAPTLGKEVGFYFDADEDLMVNVDMTPTGVDLDLFVTGGDAWGACAVGSKCIDSSRTGGVESVSFDARHSRRYWFMVDAAAGVQGNFEITVSCASP